MIPINLGDQLQLKTLKVAATDTTASVNGSAVDLQGLEGEIAIILNAAHGSGNTDNTLSVKIQHSDDTVSGNFSDVSGAVFTTVDGTTDSAQLMSLKKDELKRYIRYVSTMAGTSKSFVWGAIAVGMNKYL